MFITKDILKSVRHSVTRNGLYSTLLILYHYIAIKMSLKEYYSFYIGKIGCEVTLRPGNSDFSVFRQIFMNGEYDIQLPITPKVIIDAGANIGLASLIFNFNFPESIIYAMEPDPENFKLLTHQTRNFKNIKVFPYALWSCKTNLLLNKQGYDAWGVRVSKSISDKSNTVNGIDLFSFMQENAISEVDLLKIDIEGAEAEIFGVNFEHWLTRTKILVIEVHENLQAGTEKIFYSAIACINHRIERSGENIVVFNLDLL